MRAIKYLLIGTIWLSFNLPCQTYKGHHNSTVVMIYPPASKSRNISD